MPGHAFDDDPPEIAVSTGRLPSPEITAALLIEAVDRYRDVDAGEVADYIPALAAVDPSLFGASIVGVGGRSFGVGDSNYEFSLQSISKAFVFALVCGAIGDGAAREHLGVRATGLPFNSVMAIELNEQRTMNPMVNAGAITAEQLGDRTIDIGLPPASNFAD